MKKYIDEDEDKEIEEEEEKDEQEETRRRGREEEQMKEDIEKENESVSAINHSRCRRHLPTVVEKTKVKRCGSVELARDRGRQSPGVGRQQL